MARSYALRPAAAGGPHVALADAIAAEWEDQQEVIDPARMPLTRLANTIIDGVAAAAPAVAAEIEQYLATDLLFYRADGPERLVERQRARWDPILAWARAAFGARFELVEGVIHIVQPAESLRAVAAAIPRDPWRLGAVHAVTTLTGSALIALALAHGGIDVDAAWTAAHVDEDWNMELWGRDEIALERRASVGRHAGGGHGLGAHVACCRVGSRSLAPPVHTAMPTVGFTTIGGVSLMMGCGSVLGRTHSTATFSAHFVLTKFGRLVAAGP